MSTEELLAEIVIALGLELADAPDVVLAAVQELVEGFEHNLQLLEAARRDRSRARSLAKQWRAKCAQARAALE